MKLTVSMITMNEERAIAKVVQDIRRVVPDAEIFVVDSSRDRTAEIAQELGCRVFKQFPPKGYGPAMDRAVRDASGDVVITLDCDDTYPVEAIPTERILAPALYPGWLRSKGRWPIAADRCRLDRRSQARPASRQASCRRTATGREGRRCCPDRCCGSWRRMWAPALRH